MFGQYLVFVIGDAHNKIKVANHREKRLLATNDNIQTN